LISDCFLVCLCVYAPLGYSSQFNSDRHQTLHTGHTGMVPVRKRTQ